MGGSPSGWLLLPAGSGFCICSALSSFGLQTVHIDFVEVAGVMTDVRYQRLCDGDRCRTDLVQLPLVWLCLFPQIGLESDQPSVSITDCRMTCDCW